MKITHASRLTDNELVTAVARLAHGEREATVALIVHLAEFDARRLFTGEGFPSTFKYCLEVLHLSEDAAFNRIEAARTARRFPAVLEMLIAGALSPTTARMLARHLTLENHEGLLAAASGKSKQEVERLLACHFPQADVAPSIRKVPATRATPMPVALLATHVASPVSDDGDRSFTAPPTAPASQASMMVFPLPVRRPVVRPLSTERYEIRFTASAETREKLRRAQDLLGHALPSGDLAQVFDRALTLLVEDLERKKLAATRRPRRSPGQAEGSRNIPAEVRRAVVARDRDRCAYVATDGRRCGERRFLEFHHVRPYGAGGKPTVDNIQLRCRAHNRYEAELFYAPGRRYGGAEIPPVPERVTTRPSDQPEVGARRPPGIAP
jgi:hypothetical protein